MNSPSTAIALTRPIVLPISFSRPSRTHLNFKSAVRLASPYTSSATLLLVIDSFPYKFRFWCDSHRPASPAAFDPSLSCLYWQSYSSLLILHLTKSVLSWISSNFCLECSHIMWLVCDLAACAMLICDVVSLSVNVMPGTLGSCVDGIFCMSVSQMSAKHVRESAVRSRCCNLRSCRSMVMVRSSLSACFLLPCARLISLRTGCSVISLRGRCCLLCAYNILVCTRYSSGFCNKRNIFLQR